MDFGPFVLILVGLLLGALFLLLSQGRPVGGSLYGRYRRAVGSDLVLGIFGLIQPSRGRGPGAKASSRARRRRRRRTTAGRARWTRRGRTDRSVRRRRVRR